jgi:hypothetical protein
MAYLGAIKNRGLTQFPLAKKTSALSQINIRWHALNEVKGVVCFPHPSKTAGVPPNPRSCL